MLQVALKSLRLLLHIATGLLLALAVGLDFGDKLPRERLTSWWNQRLLAILNIRLKVRGSGVSGSRVLVANHISWLDIPVIASLEATRFVAKSEIRHWPVAGWLAQAAGAFFIRRGPGGAKPLLENLRPHLRAGGSFVFFPEGTTTAGASVLRFHPRLFQAALEAGCPVQPMALRYGFNDEGIDIAPFVGDDDLVSHILRVLQTRELRVEITYCPVISPLGHDRDSIALLAHHQIRCAITPLGVGRTVNHEQTDEPALTAA
jgi:1-acyl-sn-glycerol-3-phosphate acyltransferase